MGKSEIIAGLDMGSSRVTCVIAERDEEHNKIRVLAGASVPCKGLKNCVVVNIEETARAVNNVMDAAESKANEVVGEVYLGVRGSHIQAFDNKGGYNIARTDKEITADDVASVIESAKTVPLSSDREILHVIPQGFSLDRQRGVPNPIGMEGALLEVGVHIVTASSSIISNLMKSVSRAGFRVVAPIYTLLAVGELVVSEEEKDLGCLLIDAGGQITSVGIYSEGSIHFSKEIAIGGDYITRDIAYGLGTTMMAAQEIKEKYGAVFSNMLEEEKVISITKLDARTKKEVKPRELLDFIQPRAEEIFEKISQSVQGSNYGDLPGGAIITGGASLLKGMPEAAEQLLDLSQARLGIPAQEILQCPEEYMTQSYLGAVALVCYPHLKSWNTDTSGPARGGSIEKKLWRWFKDLF
ncbi:MAG: cell division protein FtsA [Elusimicrobia bacterium CG_4_10_14_0_2_um_filter_56_8]|nr:MAG: cell division protein FtsA [Elusimicrobia bacterium CG1_02_56_21]PJA13101.1 MAG: cell division protein FtsA [Elusimicrobia bacterium CG_4_10_14_0_2_um_filter_56_8]